MPNEYDSMTVGSENTLEWFCLRTQVKREHIAAAMLSRLENVDVFCPRISQVKKTKTGKKRFVEAMFPGYIFACFSFRDNYRRVIYTQGVSALVAQGDRRAIPEHIIQELRTTLPEGIIEAPDLSILPGAQVEFVAGSLKGLNGTVIAQLPAENRVQVLLDFLGREITVAVSAEGIIASDKGKA
ncbi:MAG: transcription termination/antitermination protein NusG [Opitutales bacterium]|jgi:transcriptional antiterminator RfaH